MDELTKQVDELETKKNAE